MLQYCNKINLAYFIGLSHNILVMRNYIKNKGIAVRKKTDDGIVYSIKDNKVFFTFLDKNGFRGKTRTMAEDRIFFQEDGPEYFFQAAGDDLYLITKQGGLWEIDFEEEETLSGKTDYVPKLVKIDRDNVIFWTRLKEIVNITSL